MLVGYDRGKAEVKKLEEKISSAERQRTELTGLVDVLFNENKLLDTNAMPNFLKEDPELLRLSREMNELKKEMNDILKTEVKKSIMN